MDIFEADTKNWVLSKIGLKIEHPIQNLTILDHPSVFRKIFDEFEIQQSVVGCIRRLGAFWFRERRYLQSGLTSRINKGFRHFVQANTALNPVVIQLGKPQCSVFSLSWFSNKLHLDPLKGLKEPGLNIRPLKGLRFKYDYMFMHCATVYVN